MSQHTETRSRSGPASEVFTIAVAGHVDHGKSTILGRMLADAGALPQGKLEQVKSLCEKTDRPFEYAFLLDALKDEQSQGITIDSARIFFRTARRRYLVIDNPGHVEFIKNMVTGASRADAAFVVIDASEGVRENSRRHAYLLSFLDIRRIAVIVNKMDLVGWDRAVFEAIREEFTGFVRGLGLEPSGFVPASGLLGDNVVARGRVSWYEGPTVLETLEAFAPRPLDRALPMRLPVQDVYKFTGQGDERRIVAGHVETGSVTVGDRLVFMPSCKEAVVASIEAHPGPGPSAVDAGMPAGLTLTEQIYVARGQVACRVGERLPQVARRFRATVFWMGRAPLRRRQDYVLRLTTARAKARVESFERIFDVAAPDRPIERDRLERHEVGEVTLSLDRPLALDRSGDLQATGRFVLVDDHEVSGGGIVTEVLPDDLGSVRQKVLVRNQKWEASNVSRARRAEKYNQRATLLLITGGEGPRRKEIAKALEQNLFEAGRVVYYLGMGSLKYGVDADGAEAHDRTELMRRLGEVAHILLDVGAILIVSAQSLVQADLEVVRAVVDPDQIETVWLGETVETDLTCDLRVPPCDDADAVQKLKGLLQDRGIIFRP